MGLPIRCCSSNRAHRCQTLVLVFVAVLVYTLVATEMVALHNSLYASGVERFHANILKQKDHEQLAEKDETHREEMTTKL